jgi:hypothetical protein
MGEYTELLESVLNEQRGYSDIENKFIEYLLSNPMMRNTKVSLGNRTYAKRTKHYETVIPLDLRSQSYGIGFTMMLLVDEVSGFLYPEKTDLSFNGSTKFIIKDIDLYEGDYNTSEEKTNFDNSKKLLQSLIKPYSVRGTRLEISFDSLANVIDKLCKK